MRRTALAVLAVFFIAAVVSAAIDMRSPDDFDHEPGCHMDWLGMVPVGRYCVFP